MDLKAKLDQVVSLVEGARSMPMSASCVVNRAELLGHLDQMRELRPAFLVPGHTLPVSGEKEIETRLTDYRDAIRMA